MNLRPVLEMIKAMLGFGVLFLMLAIILGYALLDTFPFPPDSELCKYRDPRFFIPRIYNRTHLKCRDYWVNSLNLSRDLFLLKGEDAE